MHDNINRKFFMLNDTKDTFFRTLGIVISHIARFSISTIMRENAL